MKSVLSISFALWLLILGLMPGMDSHDIPKLPNLFTHFLDHSHDGKEISFWDYLADHYGHHSDSENEEDHKILPFHKHCCSATFFVVSEVFILTDSQILVSSLKRSFYNQGYYSAYYNSIFLPPKI